MGWLSALGEKKLRVEASAVAELSNRQMAIAEMRMVGPWDTTCGGPDPRGGVLGPGPTTRLSTPSIEKGQKRSCLHGDAALGGAGIDSDLAFHGPD